MFHVLSSSLPMALSMAVLKSVEHHCLSLSWGSCQKNYLRIPRTCFLLKLGENRSSIPVISCVCLRHHTREVFPCLVTALALRFLSGACTSVRDGTTDSSSPEDRTYNNLSRPPRTMNRHNDSRTSRREKDHSTDLTVLTRRNGASRRAECCSAL